MRVLATPRFERAVKKLTAREKAALDGAVRAVVAAPESGEMKRGDLSGIRVYKYRHLQQQMLLAYAANTEQGVVILLGYGTHENL